MTNKLSKKKLTKLKKKFDELTCYMDNWKDPINSVIKVKDFEIMNEACTYYTGSELQVVSHLESRKCYWVYADGYYKAIGA